ncbi:hypothetical protein TNCV_3352821 [Trichonephila clavipes]|nr:hypothetical protein TNCV_3352821 [Trichonephila clavipes]
MNERAQHRRRQRDWPSSRRDSNTNCFSIRSKVKCLGRENEKKIVVNCLTSLGAKIKNLGEMLPLVLITGQIGMGKTTLLEWAMDKAEDMGFK